MPNKLPSPPCINDLDVLGSWKRNHTSRNFYRSSNPQRDKSMAIVLAIPLSKPGLLAMPKRWSLCSHLPGLSGRTRLTIPTSSSPYAPRALWLLVLGFYVRPWFFTNEGHLSPLLLSSEYFANEHRARHRPPLCLRAAGGLFTARHVVVKSHEESRFVDANTSSWMASDLSVLYPNCPHSPVINFVNKHTVHRVIIMTSEHGKVGNCISIYWPSALCHISLLSVEVWQGLCKSCLKFQASLVHF